MNYEFFSGFVPHILNVVDRDERFWSSSEYELYRPRTKLNILALVYSGEGTLVRNEEKFPLRRGAFFHLWPNVEMNIQTTASDPVCFYSVHFYYTKIKWTGHKPVLSATRNMDHPQPLPLPSVLALNDVSHVHQSFIRLKQIWSRKEIGYAWHAQCELLQMLRFVDESEKRKQVRTEETTIAETITEWMKANLHESLSRDKIAKYANVSPGYLSVLFKKQTGISPIQYLTRLRMDRAKELLQSSHLNIAEIAQQVGYHDPFYFTRVFKNSTGISPRDYRKA